MNYIELAEAFRPEEIRILLIGEAPPPNGTSYFYLPRVLPDAVSIRDDRSLPTTIFYHYFKERPTTIARYRELLLQLKAMGVFLVDIYGEPIQVRNHPENQAVILNAIPTLKERLELRNIIVNEAQMIFLVPRGGYKRTIRECFPAARIVTWIDFRLED